VGKLRDTQRYLLENWTTAAVMREEMDGLDQYVKELTQRVADNLSKQKPWSQCEPELSISRWGWFGFWRKPEWRLDWEKGYWVTVAVGGLVLNRMLGHDEDAPDAHIWIPLGEGAEKTKQLRELIRVEAKSVIDELMKEHKEKVGGDRAFGYVLPHTPKQWIELLDAGRFEDEVTRHFNTLARFIEPVDRALRAIRKSR
jgi:hypothetical protein